MSWRNSVVFGLSLQFNLMLLDKSLFQGKYVILEYIILQFKMDYL